MIDNETIYIRQIPKKYINRVILGYKLENREIDRLSNELKIINPDIEIALTKVTDKGIEINNIVVKSKA